MDCSDAAFTILNVHHFMFYCAMLACELIVCTSSFRGFHILNNNKIVRRRMSVFLVVHTHGTETGRITTTYMFNKAEESFFKTIKTVH